MGLGVFDLIYGSITSEFFMMPLTFGYVAIGWILAVIAIATGVGLWKLQGWGYRMAIIFGTIEIVLASFDILLAYSGHWERTILNMGVTLEEIGYTHQALVMEVVITSLLYYVISGLFLVAVWKMKTLIFLEPSDVFLNYLKLYRRISMREMARRTGITEVDVELLALELSSKGEPVELNLQARELTYKGKPDVRMG